jgi:hypothetical protein
MGFIGLFVVISAVFAFLAWRMDRKHHYDVTFDYKADIDKRSARAVFGDDFRGHESGPRL